MIEIKKQLFGKDSKGNDIFIFTIKTSSGSKAEFLSFGAALHSIWVPNKNGTLSDVVLGYETIDSYEQADEYLGAVIGRHANRIEKGNFVLNGIIYQLYCNDGNNHLHGGKYGFDKKIWDSQIEENKLIFHYKSVDGEEGYPGNLDVTVCYEFTEDNCLTIEYTAQTDADTVINLTNHAYFNLSGENNGEISNHILQLFADSYTENNAECIPNGIISSVENTPFDFREPMEIGKHINDHTIQLENCGGYDHNFILNKDNSTKPQLAAVVYSPQTGIKMETYTTQPGLQFYSGNFLKSSYEGKSAKPYSKRSGFCLETQFYPNGMKYDSFPTPILKKGETYHHITKYCFSITK